jgi:ABC-type sugar transport system permease subunit
MAFEQLQFSLAAAMSWVLFFFICILTALNFKLQKWVNYGEDS